MRHDGGIVPVHAVPAPPDATPSATARATADATRIGALDGLRALAVLAVVAYHLWPGLVPGGFLGVDLFMVLSGFLITGLLLDEHGRHGGIRLGAFWARRFRRLVPALVGLLTGVAVFVAVAGPEALEPVVRGQGLASLLYVGNWKLVADGVSYAALSGPQSPLLHLWSLSVEEQFYVLWPLLVAGTLAWSARRRGASTGPLLALTAAGVVASSAWMAIAYEPGSDPLRLYFGTDTRAHTFLVGAAAAIALRSGAGARLVRAGARLGGAGLLLVAAAWLIGPSDGVLYRSGFLVFAAVAAAVVLGATAGSGAVVAVCDRAPLRLLGRVSYGIYLWHWPVIVLVTPERAHADGLALDAVHLALTAALTAASWWLVEVPSRRPRGRRSLAIGLATMGVAALALVPLRSESLVAYADVAIDDIPDARVVEPAGSATTSPTAAGEPGLAGTTATTAPTTTPAVPPPLALPAAGTMLVIGDSGMYDESPALTAAFGAAGWQVVDASFPGVGLTRPEARQVWRDAVAEHQPALSIVLLGGWDLDLLEQQGDDAYAAVVEETVGELTAAGGKILWLSTLPANDLPQAVRLSAVFERVAARHPGVVEYLDIAPVFADADGGYPIRRDGVLLRKPDGFHLCPAGAELLTQAVVDHLQLTPDPAWTTGGWRTEPRYDDPPGGCA